MQNSYHRIHLHMHVPVRVETQGCMHASIEASVHTHACKDPRLHADNQTTMACMLHRLVRAHAHMHTAHAYM